MEFYLIWLDGWLNWPRGIIFRQDSEPKSLQTHRNLFEHTKKHLPKKSKNVIFSENRFLLENSFVKSRPGMAALVDPQSGKYSYIDPLSFIVSKKNEKKLDFHDQNIAFYLKCLISTPVFPGKSPFSFGALFDLFLVEHISIYIYICILISEIWLNGPRSAGWLNGPRSKQALKCGGTCLRRKFMAEKWPFKKNVA